MCEKKNQLWNVFGFGFVFLGSRKISENIIGWSPTTELYEIHGWNEWNSEKNWSNLSKHKLCISSISNLIAWRFERIFPRKYALLENINLLPQKYSEWSSTRNEIMYSYIYFSLSVVMRVTTHSIQNVCTQFYSSTFTHAEITYSAARSVFSFFSLGTGLVMLPVACLAAFLRAFSVCRKKHKKMVSLEKKIHFRLSFFPIFFFIRNTRTLCEMIAYSRQRTTTDTQIQTTHSN